MRVRSLNIKRRWSLLWKRLRTKRVRRIVLVSLAVIAGVFVVAQWAYPRDRALPGTLLAEHDISGWTTSDIMRLASELYDLSTVEVEGSDKTMLARSLLAVGVELRTEDVAQQATEYAWWLRFVPTSIFWAGAAVGELDPIVDQQQLDAFVSENEADFYLTPENAKLVVEGAEVKVREEVPGATLSADQFKQGVKSARYVLGGPTVLDVRFTYTEAAITSADLAGLAGRANAVIARGLVLEFDGVQEKVDQATLASWLMFEQAEAQSAADVTVDSNTDTALQFVHTKFDQAIARPAGVTDVYLTDGVEQSRTAGADGRAVDEGAMAGIIREALFGEGSATTVQVATRTVAPSIKRHHTFTQSQRGLQAYLNSLADEGDIRVSVAQLGGAGWSASYRGGEQTVAASTYKVYAVAYALNQIAEGKLSYDDTVNGTTFRECMNRAIIRSDNACPEAILEKFGRATVNAFFYDRGYSRATNLNHSTASQSSTADLIKAMTEIENGTLVKGAERSFMIGLMREQIYRQGIPAGTSASSAGKVGFLWGYLNDAAIVYHPRGTYALSVMTNNTSWSKIAEITRKIEGIMY